MGAIRPHDHLPIASCAAAPLKLRDCRRLLSKIGCVDFWKGRAPGSQATGLHRRRREPEQRAARCQHRQMEARNPRVKPAAERWNPNSTGGKQKTTLGAWFHPTIAHRPRPAGLASVLALHAKT